MCIHIVLGPGVPGLVITDPTGPSKGLGLRTWNEQTSDSFIDMIPAALSN